MNSIADSEEVVTRRGDGANIDGSNIVEKGARGAMGIGYRTRLSWP
jgi:hypothetical protein